jgi:hypothetical protein
MSVKTEQTMTMTIARSELPPGRMPPQVTPDAIMQLGLGFWGSKTC